jgi:hypothetical protein
MPPVAVDVAVTVWAPVSAIAAVAAPPSRPPAPPVAVLEPFSVLACVVLAVTSLKVRLDVAVPH